MNGAMVGNGYSQNSKALGGAKEGLRTVSHRNHFATHIKTIIHDSHSDKEFMIGPSYNCILVTA